MAEFRCKMCGGSFEIQNSQKIVTCEYCGSIQTIPCIDEEKILKLYRRGNNLRNQYEFDKAYSIYEQIISEGKEEAEVYWNLLLCKYGVTYVDDYDSRKKPTMNRMSFNLIIDDNDYQRVLELADVVSKKIYKNQVKEILEIQNKIIEISKKEKPYDIFISYKETDENGDRTEDSVIAQEIYDDLTKEGYRVFLARVSLSSMVGQEYEPVIYSALHTSKIMILVGTDEDYINSTWVKNEWSRFIGMMKNDSSKNIIPCYKRIDAYDLPKEIRNIQGINFEKLGAIQDLKLGIRKLFGYELKENKRKKNSELNNLYDALEVFLNKSNFKGASAIIEQLTAFDSNNTDLLFYSFLVSHQCKDKIELYEKYTTYFEGEDYQTLKNNSEKSELISDFLKGLYTYIYFEAGQDFEQERYLEASKKYFSLENYKDSLNKALESKYVFLKNEINERIFNCQKFSSISKEEYKLVEELETIDVNDSKEYLEKTKLFIKEIREEEQKQKHLAIVNRVRRLCEIKRYDEALAFISKNKDCIDAEKLIAMVQGYKNEDVYSHTLKVIKNLLSDIKKENEPIFYQQLDKLAKIEDYKDTKEQIKKCKAEFEEKLNVINRKKKKITYIILGIIGTLILTLILFLIFRPISKYNNAKSNINDNNYNEAIAILMDLDYKNSKELLNIAMAEKAFEQQNLEQGIDYVLSVNKDIHVEYIAADGSCSMEQGIINKTNPNEYLNVEATKEMFYHIGWVIEAYDVEVTRKDIHVSLTLNAIFEYMYKYEVVKDEIYITGVSDLFDKEVIAIPGEIEGKPVTQISPGAFYNCKTLKSVTLSNQITIIGDNAFKQCSSLINIILNDSLQSIGNSAFTSCTSLREIIIPSTVYYVGGFAFSECNMIVIYCKADKQPSSWNPNWNYYNRPVQWGY